MSHRSHARVKRPFAVAEQRLRRHPRPRDDRIAITVSGKPTSMLMVLLTISGRGVLQPSIARINIPDG